MSAKSKVVNMSVTRVWQFVAVLSVVGVLMAGALGALCPVVAYADTVTDNASASATSHATEDSSANTGTESDTADSDTDVVGMQGIAEGMADGVYYGSGEGYQSTITVAVTVENERITQVKIVSHADDTAYIARAEGLIDDIVNQQIADVDTVSGVTYSSKGIIAAVKDAMSGSGTLSVTGSVWFTALVILIAILLFAAAVLCAVKWQRVAARKERLRFVRLQQLALQGMFFILAPASFATGFMGLKTLFMQINVMNTHRGYDFEVMSFTILLVLLLLFVVFFGRFFCGYACAFGLLGDLMYRLSTVLFDKLHIKRKPLPRVVELVLRSIKYVILLVICIAVLMGAYTTVNANSPWTAFSNLVNLNTSRVTVVSAILLALIVIVMFIKERSFCEYFCPLGALYSIMPVLPTGRMKRQRPKCVKGCSSCKDHCPMTIEPKQKILAGECIDCGQCAEVCPVHNVTLGLELRHEELKALEEAQVPQSDGKSSEVSSSGDETPRNTATQVSRINPRVLMTSRPVAALWKAVLMLFILWIMGATRYLPTLFG